MALPSDISIKERISNALSSYVAGVEDKFGGTELTTLIGVLKADGVKNRNAIEEAVVALLLSNNQAECQEYFLALSRIISDLSINNTKIVAEIEALFHKYSKKENVGILSLLIQMYVNSGGDLTPKLLEKFDTLRAFRTKHWASYAIRHAYHGDIPNLTQALIDLNTDSDVKWESSYLIDLYDDVESTYNPKDSHDIFKGYIEGLASITEKEVLYSFYQHLTGRNIRSHEKRTAEPTVTRIIKPAFVGFGIDPTKLLEVGKIKRSARGPLAKRKSRMENRECVGV